MSGWGKRVVHNRTLSGRPPTPAIYARIEERARSRGGVLRGAPPAVAEIEVKGWLDRAIAESPRWLRGLAGGLLWGALHKRALAVPSGSEDGSWLAAFRRILPCGDCRKHWDAMLADTPPDWGAYFAWTVDRHNEVNRRLGKPEMGLEEALQRWGGAANKAPIHRTSSGS